jgi:hypothetical protein
MPDARKRAAQVGEEDGSCMSARLRANRHHNAVISYTPDIIIIIVTRYAYFSVFFQVRNGRGEFQRGRSDPSDGVPGRVE